MAEVTTQPGRGLPAPKAPGGEPERGLPVPPSGPEAVARLVLQQQVEAFLYREARYLDERRLNEWLDFFAEDVHYFMPIRRNIKYGDWDLEYSDPESEISYFDEGKDILTGRVRQLNTGVHWAEEPVSRFEHLISNVEVLKEEGDTVEAASKFYVYQNRLQDEVQVFCGRRYDLLRRDPETTFKIVKRKILLAQNVLLPKVINTFF
jgi:3-phenylpropionate/cinnamic acid dioxygenase small subunit